MSMTPGPANVDMVRLGEDVASVLKHGSKAAVLSRLALVRGLQVPDGWCVSLHDVTWQDIKRHGVLDTVWTSFADQRGPLAVRSSASVEDVKNALFAGRFASELNITSKTALYGAIKRVMSSIHEPAVVDYANALALSLEDIQMSVVVQRQVEPKFAGVAFTRSPVEFPTYDMLVEFVDGASGPMLTGELRGATYGVSDARDGTSRSLSSHHVAGATYDLRDLAIFLPKVYETCKRVEEELGRPQDVEWAWDGESVWVLQSRDLADGPLQVPTGFPLGRLIADGQPPVLKSLPTSTEWGLKGAAEQYFMSIGRGAKNCLLIQPGTDDPELWQMLDHRQSGPDGTVIRFSHGAQVGLPKRFVPPGEDLYAAYESVRGGHVDWMGIVSDYIFISSSFEAYVTNETLLVEHVPGNWEPDNLLAPDVFKFTKSGAELFLYRENRDAKLEVPSLTSATEAIFTAVQPLTEGLARIWAEQFVNDFRIVGEYFAQDLPLNVHFISDTEGRFYFLNIRPTAELDVASFGRVADGVVYKSNRFFTVNRPNDLTHWDGQANILVDCIADRGHESRIAGVAKALRDAGVEEVFCTFGILSHPAIVLREFSLRVRPLYISHSVVSADLRW